MLDAVTLGITQWYEEIDHYNYNSPAYKGSNGEMLGHFTQVRSKTKSQSIDALFQLVWKDSQKMGIGVSKMKLNGWDAWMVVVHYDPPGNFNNAFSTNVLPLK